MKHLLNFILLLLAVSHASAGVPGLRVAGKAEAMGYAEGDTLMVIPAHVRTLPAFCFAGCEDLKEVRFEKGSQCTAIGEYCFAECISLRIIELPENIATVGEGCFRECRSLERLKVPDSITILPKEFCHRCVGLKEVRLPAKLKDIGSFAFAGCEALERVTLPSTLSHIGSNAFSLCRSLSGAVIPDGVKELESYAFAGCTALTSLKLPTRKDMLGELIVADCPSLMEIIEPSPLPPGFDCNSYLFEPDDTAAYERCALRVPAGSIHLYRQSPSWGLFTNILPL